jgi:cytochrome c oxidase assembly factor CtaG
MYDSALTHPGVHVLEHLTFACAGFLYWWHLLSPIRSRHRLGGMGPIVYMLSTKLLVGILGIGLTFAPDPLYHHYTGGTWGLTAEEDEQIGGALMAIEQSIIMGIALAWLFVRMLEESQRDDERDERYRAVQP